MGKGKDDEVVDNWRGGELWHREQRHRRQQVHLRGAAHFLWSVFFTVLPLWDASIFQYVYISSLWKSEYFLFSSDKSFIGKKYRLSIIK